MTDPLSRADTHAHGFPRSMKVEVDADELAALRAELARLQARETELLENNTKQVNLRRAVDRREQVMAFHRAMGQPVLDRPQVPPDDRVRLRGRLMAEEFLEVIDAMFNTDTAEACEVLFHLIRTADVCIDMEEVADGLADLDYVVEGTRLEFGINGGPLAAEVQRSNMAKVGATVREDGKVMKPPGWTPPDIRAVLLAQGWTPPEVVVVG